MKRFFSALLVFFLAGVIPVCANGDQEAGGSENNSQKVIELDFNDWNPEGSGPAVELWKPVVEMIAEKSGGRIQVTNYLSGSLVKFPETFKGVSSGVADISLYMIGGTPGIHYLTEVTSLPLLGFKSYDQATQIFNELIEEFPEIQEESAVKNVRILSIRPMNPDWIHSVKKPIRSPEDLRGQKMIASGYGGMIASLADGVAINNGPADWYSSLQKGVFGHIDVHWPAFGIFQLQEVCKYHTQFGEGGLSNLAMSVVINLDTWNSLSPEDQKIIEDAYKWYQVEVRKADIGMAKHFEGEARASGEHTFIELTPEEKQVWIDEIGKPIHEKWIADMDKVGKGDTAREMLHYIEQRINELD